MCFLAKSYGTIPVSYIECDINYISNRLRQINSIDKSSFFHIFLILLGIKTGNLKLTDILKNKEARVKPEASHSMLEKHETPE